MGVGALSLISNYLLKSMTPGTTAALDCELSVYVCVALALVTTYP